MFDTDAAADARDQGGSLDLHPEEGQLALQKAGVLDAFLAVARHDDQEQRVVDHATGVVVRQEVPEPGAGQRPEIDRLVLRRLLLAPLDKAAIHWDTRIDDVVVRPDRRVDLRYRADVTGPYDLVIGADGAWSKVRSVLTPVRPSYTGVTFVELWMGDVDRVHPVASALVKHGTMFSLHDGAGIIAQRNGNGVVRVYAAFRTRKDDTDRPDKKLANLTRHELLERFRGWAPSLRALLSEADRIVAVRPIVALPVQARWQQREGLTLVGDAAHVMPPLGVGVNLAMLDAAELAEALVSEPDWRRAVRRVEATMMDRAGRIAAQCAVAFDDMFGSEGKQNLLEHMEARRDPDPR